VVIKTVTNADTGTADIVGGDDWDAMAAIVNDHISPFKYIIYKSGSNYKLWNSATQSATSTSTTPETLFQTALTAGGDTYVQDNTFTFSAGFAGLDFPVEPVYSRLHMGNGTHLVVPNGYTGYVFRFINTSTQHCNKNVLQGGVIDEAGAATKLYTGIKVQGTGSNNKGVFGNTVRNVMINYPRYGIVLNCDSTATGASGAFINHNIFENIEIYGAEVFIDFLMDAAYTTDSNGFHRNRFYNILMQRTSTYTLYGVKNIAHKDNIFIGCYPADFAGSQITSNIHTDARGTIIIGGSMTALNFADASTTAETVIFDITQRGNFNRITSGTLDLQPQADGNNTTFSIWNTSRNTRYFIQKSTSGTIAYLIKSVKQSGGSLLPIIWSMQDVGGGTDLEAMRINADASLMHNGYPASVLYPVKKIGSWAGQGNPSTSYGVNGTWNGAVSAIAVGTGAVGSITRQSSGTRFRWTTGGTANSLAGFRVSSVLQTERDLNPIWGCKLQLTQTANTRMIMGYTSSNAAPSSAADPLASLSGVIFFYDSGVDANWHICQNDGSASSDNTTIATVAAADTNAHTFAIRADNANTKFQYAYGFTNIATATWVDINTKIPAASTGMGWTHYMENLSGTCTFDAYWAFSVQDA